MRMMNGRGEAGFMALLPFGERPIRNYTLSLHSVPQPGISRGKTTCLLVTRDDRVRSGAGSDPFANGLQALMGMEGRLPGGNFAS